jgi:hydrogenase maturation protein HypF
MTISRGSPQVAAATEVPSARRITVAGIVQGVGFRPFVYNLARRYGLGGWVRNTAAGVEIVVVGPDAVLDAFAAELPVAAPPLAVLDRITVEAIPLPGAPSLIGTAVSPLFSIQVSTATPGDFVPVSPDVATCDDCLAELRDPSDRRYGYPFINCTNCGPRYTIIRDIPYDRPQTTMAAFTMCPACQAEYDDPSNRRFHAQPNACPVCGPQVWLVPSSRAEIGLSGLDHGLTGDAAILAAQRLLVAGGIVAVKGLGGFHLACDAANDAAVAALRRRKQRGDKPFAVMARDLAAVETFAEVAPAEARLLLNCNRPILLLGQRMPFPLSPNVAPGNRTVGVMLPYTPLHHLLLDENGPAVLVMTSGNLAEEPIITDNDAALARLALLADAFLLHNRDIHVHCDDSVVRRLGDVTLPIRRGRGLAPKPIRLPFSVMPVLAVGGELKNTLCLTNGRYAFLSQHIGDLENLETLAAFERTAAHLQRLFRCEPQVVACDLHPGYLGTRWAHEYAATNNLPLIGVQHHHAHMASVMAEHGLAPDARAIGVIFDGTGYGPDGTIWGGELFVAGYANYSRLGRIAPFPLPGGDAAIQRPYRVALALLWAHGLPWTDDLPPVAACPPAERRVLAQQLARGVNTVLTSSAGRLFDAIASLAGARQTVAYEAQAAMELEALAAPLTGAPYPLPLERVNAYGPTRPSELQLAWRTDALVAAVLADVRRGVPPSLIAARFHHGLADAVLDACRVAAGSTGLRTVALSGGVFQNTTLLELVLARLTGAGFTPLVHRQVPPNDGGLALGQALVAHAQMGEIA